MSDELPMFVPECWCDETPCICPGAPAGLAKEDTER